MLGAAGLCLVALPQAAALAVESYGWKLALRVIGREVPFLPLFRVRVATEALTQSLPAGVLVGESVKPMLLKRRLGLPLNDGVAAIVARKYLLILSQGSYVVIIATLGFGALHSASLGILGSGGLEWIAYGAGSALLLAAMGLGAWLKQSPLAGATFDLLGRLPSVRLACWLRESERRFVDTDRTVSRFFREGLGSHLLPGLGFLVGWLIESSEAFLILRLLGMDVTFIEVASLEVLVTFLRHVAFVVPAGLGIQDLGYVTGLAALGVPEVASLGAAFVLIKRTKELFFVAVGYVLLALETRAPSVEPILVEARAA